MEIGGLSDCNYWWHAGGGRDGGGSTGGGRRGGPGRSSGGVQGRLSWNKLKMFHEQILSRNEAWFVKIRKSRNELRMFHEQIVSRNEAWIVKIRKQFFSLKYAMRISSENEELFFSFCHSMNSTLARIIAGISPATICCRWFCPSLRLIPVWLISSFPILTQQLSNSILRY